MSKFEIFEITEEEYESLSEEMKNSITSYEEEESKISIFVTEINNQQQIIKQIEKQFKTLGNSPLIQEDIEKFLHFFLNQKEINALNKALDLNVVNKLLSNYQGYTLNITEIRSNPLKFYLCNPKFNNFSDFCEALNTANNVLQQNISNPEQLNLWLKEISEQQIEIAPINCGFFNAINKLYSFNKDTSKCEYAPQADAPSIFNMIGSLAKNNELVILKMTYIYNFQANVQNAIKNLKEIITPLRELQNKHQILLDTAQKEKAEKEKDLEAKKLGIKSKILSSKDPFNPKVREKITENYKTQLIEKIKQQTGLDLSFEDIKVLIGPIEHKIEATKEQSILLKEIEELNNEIIKKEKSLIEQKEEILKRYKEILSDKKLYALDTTKLRKSMEEYIKLLTSDLSRLDEKQQSIYLEQENKEFDKQKVQSNIKNTLEKIQSLLLSLARIEDQTPKDIEKLKSSKVAKRAELERNLQEINSKEDNIICDYLTQNPDKKEALITTIKVREIIKTVKVIELPVEITDPNQIESLREALIKETFMEDSNYKELGTFSLHNIFGIGERENTTPELREYYNDKYPPKQITIDIEAQATKLKNIVESNHPTPQDKTKAVYSFFLDFYLELAKTGKLGETKAQTIKLLEKTKEQLRGEEAKKSFSLFIADPIKRSLEGESRGLLQKIVDAITRALRISKSYKMDKDLDALQEIRQGLRDVKEETIEGKQKFANKLKAQFSKHRNQGRDLAD